MNGDQRGELKATLSFNAPTKDYAGNDITALSRIDLLRGDKVIGSIANPAPGSAQTYVDDKAQLGDNTYTVKPYGANDEEGETAEVTVYVGIDRPSSPTNVKLVQEGNNVILTWDAPTTGANGGYIDPEQCVYAVYSSIHDGIIEEGITGTHWGADVTSMLEQDQFPLFFGVYAINAAGGSTGVRAPYGRGHFSRNGLQIARNVPHQLQARHRPYPLAIHSDSAKTQRFLLKAG